MLAKLALFARRRYRAIFVAVLGLAILCGVAASRLELDADAFHLLPRDAPEVRRLQQALERFGTLDYLLAVVEIPAGAAVDPYLELVEALGSRLEEMRYLEDVQYRVEGLEELLVEFLPKSMLFLDRRSRDELERSLRPEALGARAEELRRLLATPQSMALGRLPVLDPIGLLPVLREHFELSTGGLSFDWASGYLLSRDHRMAVVLAKPVQPPQNLEFNRALRGAVDEAIASTRAQWAEHAPDGAAAPPKIGLTGRHVIALWDDSVIRRDAAVNALTSMVGVLLLFLFAFRRLGPLLFAATPLLVGLVVTAGFAAAAFGPLSLATTIVAALLIGLAIDFVIVSYGRYVDERRQGAEVETALVRMCRWSGRAVVIGGVTSAVTFYAFVVTRFQGLRQMGLLTGSGILICMVAVLVLLPALLAWREDRHARRQRAPRHFLHSFGTDRLMDLCVRRRRATLGVGLVVTLAALIGASRLQFEDALRTMRPAGNPAFELRDEVAARFGGGFDQMMLVVDGESEPEVLGRTARASAGAERLRQGGVLTSWESVTRIIPEAERQQEALDWLAGLRRRGLSGSVVREQLEAALLAAGLRAEAFNQGLELLAAAIDVRSPLTVADVGSSATGRRLVERFLHREGESWQGVVYLYPPPGLWRREPPPAVEELARELGPHVSLVGTNVVGEYLRGQVFRDALVAAALGTALVALLLWLDFRSLRHAAAALVPLGVGIVWMLGTMGAFGLPLNFMNIFVSTMIIGIGVDYGLHMIHRYREGAAGDRQVLLAGLRETGKAIALAALSTIVAFGSLSFSHYPGLRSMGHVAVLGALYSGLVAITLLPAWLCRERGAARREASPLA